MPYIVPWEQLIVSYVEFWRMEVIVGDLHGKHPQDQETLISFF